MNEVKQRQQEAEKMITRIREIGTQVSEEERELNFKKYTEDCQRITRDWLNKIKSYGQKENRTI